MIILVLEIQFYCATATKAWNFSHPLPKLLTQNCKTRQVCRFGFDMLIASVKRGKPHDAPAFCFLIFPQFSTKVAKTEILTGATVILQGFGETTLVC